ncbi:MAG: response regulator [Planctomycetota bacterium]|jgi:DNA-binding NtrC family response regulator|nr:response regulator [Planctomycetota bacterium]
MSRAVRSNAERWPDQCLFIIDDDEHWLQVMSQALASLGWHQVRTLSNPSFAVQLAGEFRPALVLLDLLMADKDGRQVLREMRTAEPDLPIVVITGLDAVDAAVECMRAGASDYLTKPLSRAALEQALVRATAAPDPAEGDNDGADFSEVLSDLDQLPNFKEVPDLLIEEALRRSQGVVKDAAEMLGISAQAICNRKRRSRDD